MLLRHRCSRQYSLSRYPSSLHYESCFSIAVLFVWSFLPLSLFRFLRPCVPFIRHRRLQLRGAALERKRAGAEWRVDGKVHEDDDVHNSRRCGYATLPVSTLLLPYWRAKRFHEMTGILSSSGSTALACPPLKSLVCHYGWTLQSTGGEYGIVANFEGAMRYRMTMYVYARSTLEMSF